MGNRRDEGCCRCHGQLHSSECVRQIPGWFPVAHAIEANKICLVFLPVLNSAPQKADLFLGAWARQPTQTPEHVPTVGRPSQSPGKEKSNSPNQPWQSNYTARGMVGSRDRGGEEINWMSLGIIWLRTSFLLMGKYIELGSEWSPAVSAFFYSASCASLCQFCVTFLWCPGHCWLSCQ